MSQKSAAVLTAIALALYAAAVPIIVVRSQSQYIHTSETVGTPFNEPVVGIVFGAGINADGTPKDMLRDRLDTAGDLYNQGVVRTILVSGDNSRKDYDEPTAMRNYLVEQLGIPDNVVAIDYAGRRTYDTCVRAKTIWGVEHAVLVTQRYHLSRALLTCRKLGVESVGVSANRQPYYGAASRFVREFAAIHNAILDLFFLPPKYVGGKIERDLDPID